MKRTVAVVTFLFVLSLIAFAHGKEKHVMGTVTAMSDNSITVQTSQETVTVYTMSETKFVKSGVPASIQDLKVGDRVVIHVGIAMFSVIQIGGATFAFRIRAR